MKKIALLYPYFGKLPNTFDFWLKTLTANRRPDIFIFTDQDIHAEETDNLIIKKMQFSEFVDLVSKNFQIPIELPEPYKICDYRPMFGEIFSEYLSGYDFWGYGDLDVVWGNFDTFITDSLLDNFDRISQYGHLSLFRNCKELNTLYLNELNGERPYLYSVTEKDSCTFDEWWNGRGIENIAAQTGIKEYRTLRIADVSRIYKRRNMCFKFEMNCDTLPPNLDRVFLYENSRLYSIVFEDRKRRISTEEVLYAHFQKRKLHVPRLNCTDKFWVVPNKIMYGTEAEVLDYLRSDEYEREYKKEEIAFVKFREKYPDVF